MSAELQEVLWDACQEHKVEYALALGLIETESSFNPEAVSWRRLLRPDAAQPRLLPHRPVTGGKHSVWRGLHR